MDHGATKGYISQTTIFGLASIWVLATPVVRVGLAGMQGHAWTAPRSAVVSDIQQSRSNRIHINGELVAGGAECPRLRTTDNKYYTLEGDLHGFKIGDAVEITGELVDRSHCMQDTTVQIIAIERARR
jgi:hypothetical protein